MASKKHESIAFYLLVTSILALALVSISFKYYFPDEILLVEGDEEVQILAGITYTEAVFNTTRHKIFKISISNMSSLYIPDLEGRVTVTINSNFTETLTGPSDYLIYAGEINSLELTDAGFAVSFHLKLSVLKNRNPIYISLTTITCFLALYYFFITTNKKKEEIEVEEKILHDNESK